MHTDYETLNRRYGIPGEPSFVPGPGSLASVAITNSHGAARIMLQGAQVLSFQPRGQEPVLWLSRLARFAPGVPIRGGIPVCWPWFADHPQDPSQPAHGFARTACWQVRDAGRAENGATRLALELSASPATRDLWPHEFGLRLTVSIDAALQVDLDATNPGGEELEFTAALHTYLRAFQVGRARITGLESREYLDKVAGMARRRQHGPLSISGETDRIYLDTSGACVLEDPALARAIRVEQTGAPSTVVWNPWRAKAARMVDFGDDEYQGMLCVEAAVAGQGPLRLAAGQSHRLSTRLSVEPR